MVTGNFTISLHFSFVPMQLFPWERCLSPWNTDAPVSSEGGPWVRSRQGANTKTQLYEHAIYQFACAQRHRGANPGRVVMPAGRWPHEPSEYDLRGIGAT